MSIVVENRRSVRFHKFHCRHCQKVSKQAWLKYDHGSALVTADEHRCVVTTDRDASIVAVGVARGCKSLYNWRSLTALEQVVDDAGDAVEAAERVDTRRSSRTHCCRRRRRTLIHVCTALTLLYCTWLPCNQQRTGSMYFKQLTLEYNVQCESTPPPPPRGLVAIFSKTVRNFLIKLYTPIMRSYLC